MFTFDLITQSFQSARKKALLPYFYLLALLWYPLKVTIEKCNQEKSEGNQEKSEDF